MFATAHVLVGAAVGQRTRTPAGAFGAGIVSHFALDVLPHWGTEGDWMRGGERRRLFLTVAVADGLTALAALAWVHQRGDLRATAGALGGVLPDLDKPAELVGLDPWPDVVNAFHGGIQRFERRRNWPMDALAAAAGALSVARR